MHNKKNISHPDKHSSPQRSGAFIYRYPPVFFVLLVIIVLLPTLHPTRAAPVGRSTLASTTVFTAPSSPFRVEIAEDMLPVELLHGESTEIELTMYNDSETMVYTPTFYEAHARPEVDSVQEMVPSELQYVGLPQQSERVDPQIARDIAEASDAQTEFLVFLDEQPDLSAAYAITDWSERGDYVYQTLATNAARSQRDLRRWLDQRGLEYQSFWIVNAIAVQGDQTDVAALSAHADVAMLRANYPASLELMPYEPAEVLRQSTSPRFLPLSQTTADAQWNISQVGADRVWSEFGIDGQGITVANIDSGVRYDHPALIEQYRGYTPDEEDQHDYNWFDPDGVLLTPQDTISPGHGTHVMGTMLGKGDESTGTGTIGMAPGARWIAGIGCQGDACWESDLIAVAQWMIAPTDLNGDNPRPDLRPHIINNSWAGTGNNNFFAAYTTAWRAAGIFPVFAAGNFGNRRCNTIGSPADYANVMAVGGSNRNDQIADFSSIGPTSNDTLKPDIIGPGESILSSYATLRYGINRGTSMAAPHVAGAVALLWSANPTLIGDYETTYDVLTETAVELTSSDFDTAAFEDCAASESPNNIYGHGRLDVYAATQQVRVDIPWMDVPTALPPMAPGTFRTLPVTLDADNVAAAGTYTARILVSTADLSQTPLEVPLTLEVSAAAETADVTIRVTDDMLGTPLTGYIIVDDALRLPLDSTADTLVTLPVRAEPYHFETDVLGYINQSATLVVEADQPNTLAFLLSADMSQISIQSIIGPDDQQINAISPTLEINDWITYTVTVENSGTQPLRYVFNNPRAQFGVWRSDEPGGIEPQWIPMPSAPSSTAISLANDGVSPAIPLGFSFPYYDESYEEVYVSANGILSFAPLPLDWEFVADCLPIREATSTAIVPLRADLDPSAGGVIRSAQTADGFVVAFEDVPIADSESTVTFQVVLQPDGLIFFNYGTLDEIPKQVSVGLQKHNSQGEAIGCGKDTPITSDLTLEFRPQPDTRKWLYTDAELLSLDLQPGEHTAFEVGVKWVFGTPDYPYRGTITLKNDDQRQPTVRLPVQITAVEAPSIIWLPVVRQANLP